MTEDDIRHYARLGLVHHMLYPESLENPVGHTRSLQAFVKRNDIETFDCCLPYGDAFRREAAEAIVQSGKVNRAFAAHLFPFRKLSFASTSYSEQAQCRMIVSDMVDQAALIGATGFVFPSGGPNPATATEANYAAFKGFCLWLCERLRPHGITALLEPFDMDFDKRFLMGPTRKCVQLLEQLQTDNIGIELDVAHLPLMKEEFREAIETCGPWLKRIHLGNCVMRYPDDRFFGDNHPPIGYCHGEIDTPELVSILQTLLDIGYLNLEGRGDLVIELRPFPGRSEDESVADNICRVQSAWKLVEKRWGQEKRLEYDPSQFTPKA